MKVLIQDYSSTLSTEPKYLHRCFAQVGVDAHLWNIKEISAFDIFDTVQPEVFISHYGFITPETIKRLSGSNVLAVLNVTGATNDQIGSIEDTMKRQNIQMPLMFTNTHNSIVPVKSETKLINVLPGVDLFLPQLAVPEYTIPTAIISSTVSEELKDYVKDKDVYHLLCLSNGNGFDINVNISMLPVLYGKYDKVVLMDNIHITTSQLFFDTVFHSNDVEVLTTGGQQDTFDKTLSLLFHGSNAVENVWSEVKSQIKKKHTCFNRASRLAKALQYSDVEVKLRDLGDQV